MADAQEAQPARAPSLGRSLTAVPGGSGAPGAQRPSLRRSSTFQERVADLQQHLAPLMEQHLAPLMEQAGTMVDELNILFDPHAVGEALSEKPAQMPTTKSTAAALAAQEAVAEAGEERDLQRMGGALIDPSRIMLRDKLAFVLGVTNVCLTAFWIGRWPGTYYWFWLVKDVVLFSLRYLVYVQKGMHYMMLEYCYAANALAFYHLFFRPQSALLRRFSFSVMSGPLMWSIVAMRNSLVFHDGDKITTLMMHASPALCAWCMRWYPRPEWTAGMSAAQLADYNSASWFQMAVVPALLNVAWVAVYYLIIFVAVNKRIQERGYQNMFTAMVTRPSARKSALARLVLAAPAPIQPLFYLCVHTFAAWLSLLPTKLWFDSFWAHTAVVLLVLLWATWNGASFYFRVFAKKLMAEQAAKGQAPPPAPPAIAGGADKKAE